MYFSHTHTLHFFDNSYTSPELFLDLFSFGSYYAGTVSTTGKNFPVQLIPSATMDPGSFCFATVNDLTAHWWHDRIDVYALSTIHNKSVVTVMKWPKGSWDKRPLPCPSTIADYNTWVYIWLTSTSSYYAMTKRTHLDIMVVNACVIFRTNFPDSPIDTQKTFRLNIAENLVQPLLVLMASPTCPPYWQTAKGRRQYQQLND